MNILKNRPNILFLICIRKPNSNLFVVTRLKEPLYHNKLLRAITTKRIRQIEGCTKIIWEVNKKGHREDGPAVLCEHGEYWIINGKNHREPSYDGKIRPAVIKYLTNGSIVKEWWWNGRNHRDKVNGIHLPSKIVYEGEKTRKEWFWWGMRHRGKVNEIQLPAIVDNGTSYCSLKNYTWYWHDLLHRVDGPANIIGNPDNPIHYTWNLKKILHNPYSNPDDMENPAIVSNFYGYNTKEWWYHGNLQLATIADAILTVKGDDITIIDLKGISMKIISKYIIILKKNIYRMADIKDEQNLAAKKYFFKFPNTIP